MIMVKLLKFEPVDDVSEFFTIPICISSYLHGLLDKDPSLTVSGLIEVLLMYVCDRVVINHIEPGDNCHEIIYASLYADERFEYCIGNAKFMFEYVRN